jgi:hypothetical protein
MVNNGGIGYLGELDKGAGIRLQKVIDVNVLWDLAVHDLSILAYLIDAKPRTAVGACRVSGMPENLAYLTILYDSNLLAHVDVNWLSPVKVRRNRRSTRRNHWRSNRCRGYGLCQPRHSRRGPRLGLPGHRETLRT